MQEERPRLERKVDSLLLLCNKNGCIVACELKWMLYDNQPRSFKWLNRTVWWSVASFIYHSFQNSDETITAGKYSQQISERCIWAFYNSRHWSTGKDHSFLIKTPNHKFCNRRCKRCTNCAMKLSFICHTHRASRISTTTFSRFFTIVRKISLKKQDNVKNTLN